MTHMYDALKMDFHTRRAAPGHPVKFILHRSSCDLGPWYRNVADWQIEKSKTLYRKNLVAHFGCVNAIEFSKDGNMLVSGGDDRRVLLWNVDKAIVTKVKPRIMQAEHLSNVFSLDFSCSSEKIISAGNDDQVIVHDIITGAPLDYFVHEQPVYGVSADPVNESVFCSACDDGRILIFDIRESGNDPFCLAKLNSPFHSVMFHPVEPRLVVTANSKEGVASWDVRMPKRVFVKYGMQNSNQCCMSARFNRLGNQILVLRRRLPPILYATDSPSHLFQFNHRGYYNSCTMKSCSFAGQDDQFVLSGSDNFDLHLWKIPSPNSDQWVNKADMVLRGHRSIVNQVRYNYVHNVIASSGVEKLVKLWSPFPLPDEAGGKSPASVMNESERRIYTPDDYVSLVMQGNFMSLTYEAGRKTTREDSRMLAFFDALVQRDINGLSDDDSDNLPETSYTNTVYSSPETSSSENEDEDSNPPNYRHLFSTGASDDSGNVFSVRLVGPPTPGRNDDEESIRTETLPDQTPTSNGTAASPNDQDNMRNEVEQVEEDIDTVPALHRDLSETHHSNPSNDDDLYGGEITEQTEDRYRTANMITQLILDKEDSRRKLLLKTKRPSNVGSSNGNGHDSDSDNSKSDEKIDKASTNQASTSRPLCPARKSKKNSRDQSSNYSKSHNNFRKQLLRVRRREMASSTPVYESSRNIANNATTTFSGTSFERINELMTRNQYIDESDSSLDSSSSSSSDSSSSEEGEESESRSVMKGIKKVNPKKSPRSRAVLSTDTSSSDSEVKGDEGKKGATDDGETCVNEPSTSTNTPKDLKRKRKPQCKLNEACKAFFKKYIDADLDSQREEEEAVPCKRIHLDNVESTSTPSSTETTNEPVLFKRLAKHKDRNYRKTVQGASGSGTPPDSGIDVSKEPEPCCSKFCVDREDRQNESVITSEHKTVVVHPEEEAEEGSTDLKECSGKIMDHLDDLGFGQVDSDAESE